MVNPYEQWRRSLADDARAHELSYDAAAVARLPGPDRARAEADLLALVSEGDPMAFDTVARLGLVAALPALDRAMNAGSAWVRAAAARAVFELRGDPLAESSEGLDAGLDAWSLKESDRPEAIPALFPFLDDPGVHARVHAADGLVEKLGLTALAEPWGSPLRRMKLAHCSKLPTLRALGTAELRSALSAVFEGASPKALDLIHRPSEDPRLFPAFRSQCQARQPIDVNLLRAMSDHDRAHALTMLLSRLGSGDVHALAAVEALHTPGWRAHLRAALPLVAGQPEVEAAYRVKLGER